MARHAVIPIFVPHEGCPFDCIFCSQKKISGRSARMTTEDMKEIIESYLRTIRPGTAIEIGFYGGSFTGIEKEIQLSYLSKAFEYVTSGAVSSIRLSTRPDYISLEILDYLYEYGVRTIELGVQSLDDGVLLASGRGHTSEDVYKASELITGKGIRLGIQTMVGLPGDTREKDIETARKVITLKPDCIRIYPVLVIRGTVLSKLFAEGSYAPPSLEEAVDICSELLKMYDDSGLNVIRIGLQASEDISEGAEVAAGPVHPAFRQLVEGRLALKKIETGLNGIDTGSISKIILRTSNSNLSNVIGHKRFNIEFIKNKYPDIRIETASSDEPGKSLEVIAVTKKIY